MNLRSPRARLMLLASLALVWMGLALGRLAWLQLFRYSEYFERAKRQQQRVIEITPKRGILYDRNGHELAMSVQVDSCFAVPSEIADPSLAARLLASILDTTTDELETRLAASRSFVWIARKLPPDKVERIQELNLRGIYFQKEDRRSYPKTSLAAHVLGYVDIDEKGLGGIEYSLDEQIRGKPGRMLLMADAKRRWFDSRPEGPRPAADAGTSVVLTLDENLQYFAEKELARAMHETRAQAGTIIIQDPNSGALLAVANSPSFDPNIPGESSPDSRMDRAIGALYEPGSTFKIFTLAAAIDAGITNPDEVVDCQMGAIYIAGHRIRDHKPFGLLTVAQILAHSSDVGAIKIGLRLGAPRFYDMLRSFGFGQPTGIELPGENRGLLRRIENWTPVSVGSISMGQEVGVTPAQLITAVSAIANGGLLYHPHVILETRRGGQAIPARVPDPRRVVSEQTAATMRQMMEGVVLGGTGRLARLDGWTAAGKTGTAQKIDPATGRYSASHYVASFVGFAPLNSPAVTILVALDSPVGLHEGGQVSAPVFKRLMEQVLAHLDVPRDVPLSPQQQAMLAKKATPAAEDLSDFTPSELERAEPEEAALEPARLTPTSSPPTVELAPGDGVALPNFQGKTVREVTEECLRLGLDPMLVGNGVALEQSPEAGASMRRGGRVTVRFGRPSERPKPARRGSQ